MIIVVALILTAMVFYQKGIIFGLVFFLADWVIIGNIVKAVFGDRGTGTFVFSVVTIALGYYCAYMLR